MTAARSRPNGRAAQIGGRRPRSLVVAAGIGLALSAVANPLLMDLFGGRDWSGCGYGSVFFGSPLIQYRWPTISGGGVSATYLVPLLLNVIVWAVPSTIAVVIAGRVVTGRPARVGAGVVVGLAIATASMLVMVGHYTGQRTYAAFVVDDQAIVDSGGVTGQWSPDFARGPMCN